MHIHIYLLWPTYQSIDIDEYKDIAIITYLFIDICIICKCIHTHRIYLQYMYGCITKTFIHLSWILYLRTFFYLNHNYYCQMPSISLDWLKCSISTLCFQTSWTSFMSNMHLLQVTIDLDEDSLLKVWMSIELSLSFYINNVLFLHHAF